MEIFKRSFMTTYYADGVDFDWPCSVRIDEDLIVVEYAGEQGPVIYRGSSLGAGHYKMRKDGGGGEATLHRFPGGEILEGFWIEDVQDGMWKIRLGN